MASWAGRSWVELRVNLKDWAEQVDGELTLRAWALSDERSISGTEVEELQTSPTKQLKDGTTMSWGREINPRKHTYFLGQYKRDKLYITKEQGSVENLVPYSEKEPSIFKIGQLTPVKDLKLLVKDYEPIAKNALTILINISSDREVFENIAKDDAFLESLLIRITNPREPHANEIAMLLANMAKSDTIKRILTFTRDVPKPLTTSNVAIDQLMDCFVKGVEGSYNPKADFDYLAYLFADIAK
ncbi:MAG: hypothetical protein LQ347_007093, partial [Umbilicaria vellea]